MAESTITFLITGGAVVLFVWNRLPVGIVALAVALSLYATGILTVDQALSGFGDPTVVFIAALFVVSEALDATGVTTWAGQQLTARVGTSRTRLLVSMMLLCAVLTAVISVNGAVAALIPMVVVLAVRLGRSPAQLLMPLAFAAHAGSLLLLTGTPVNIIISETAADAGARHIGFAEFAWVGVPLVIGTIAIAVLFGEKLLPDRTAAVMPPDLSRLATTLAKEYTIRSGLIRLRVAAESRFDGAHRDAVAKALPEGAQLRGVERDGQDPGDTPLRAGDVLVVDAEDVQLASFVDDNALTPCRSFDGPHPDELIGAEYGVAEVIIPPRSEFVGHTVFPGMATSSGDLVVLAAQRGGRDLGSRPQRLEAGDTLLLRGSWSALDQHVAAPQVRVVHEPELIRRQTLPMGPGSRPALVILAVMVLLLATGWIPAAVAALLAACAMVVCRVLTVEQAHRSMSWTTLILVGAMIPLSTAIRDTGAADRLASVFMSVLGDADRHLVLVGLFLVTVTLGQLISNTATTLIIAPIAVVIAADLGVSPLPLLMTVCVAAAASFFAPVATPANMMIMGPGGYRFGDYWKLGAAMMVWFLLVAVIVVPVIWSF
ncbi:SLC13 family permease [Nocardia cyriacigeorgica]|uniref:SLC13 family permease n=1 Tax=Nocardia cyriacigeorgica TaxID=135487 RepID=UPI002455DFF0|nr:SLC13 family permease [Nocardia cyriacigeorgica]